MHRQAKRDGLLRFTPPEATIDGAGAGIELGAINAMDSTTFTAALGGVFEHSPWVAGRAWQAGPFTSIAALHEAMVHAVVKASRDEQLALLRAHPELAGREASHGAMTQDSTTEQGRLGFAALQRAEFERVARLNRAYREKFGFPAIVALALHRSRCSVLDEIERRIANDVETEIGAGLAEVAHISRARLQNLVTED